MPLTITEKAAKYSRDVDPKQLQQALIDVSILHAGKLLEQLSPLRGFVELQRLVEVHKLAALNSPVMTAVVHANKETIRFCAGCMFWESVINQRLSWDWLHRPREPQERYP